MPGKLALIGGCEPQGQWRAPWIAQVSCGLLLSLVMGLVGTPRLCLAFDPASITGQIVPNVVLLNGYLSPEDTQPFAVASGYLIDDGYLISVNNVFTEQGGRRLCQGFLVRFADGREARAVVHSADAMLNLILLRLVGADVKPEQVAVFHNARPGDRVLALAGAGAGGAVAHSVGTVKARHKKSVYGAGLGDMFIDSLISLPPNGDGGPLIDDRGRLLGVNTPNIHRPPDVEGDPHEAHALPIRVVTSFYKVAQAFPTTEQLWLGFALRPPNPDEKKKAYVALGQSAGLVVDYVWAEGPAGRLDVTPGDVLVDMDGQRIEHLHELDRLLRNRQAGESARLAFLRGGLAVFRTVVLERRPLWAGYVNWRLPPAGSGVTQVQQTEPLR